MLKFIKPLADTVCLYHPFGGLGDHLQHSTLPRLFSSINKKVFISTKCNFSNKEIKELDEIKDKKVKELDNLCTFNFT